MLLAAVAILLYYPMSIYLYPFLQFKDKKLDVKLNPNILILTKQFNFILLALSTFMPTDNKADYKYVYIA